MHLCINDTKDEKYGSTVSRLENPGNVILLGNGNMEILLQSQTVSRDQKPNS
jgi:hypothetical protein